MQRDIPELYGLRGIAALMIVIWHYTGCLFTPEFGTWTPYFFKVVVFGRTGVDLFLVLSGFLIIGILIDNRDSPNVLKAFYLRRAARILPAYFLLVAVTWIGFAIIGPNRIFNDGYGWTQFFLLTNWTLGLSGGSVTRTLDVTWSVALEEQFYLMFPFVVFLTRPKRLRAVLISIALASILGRTLMYALRPDLDMAPYVWTPFRLDALCVGGLVAIWWRQGHIGDGKALAVVLTAAAAVGVPLMLYRLTRDFNGTMYSWGHTFLAAFYAIALMVILAKIKAGAGVGLLRARPLVYAGTISYGMYLYHPMALVLIFFLADRTDRITNRYEFGLMLLAIPVTWIMCELSYRIVEKPIRRWGHQAKYSEAGIAFARGAAGAALKVAAQPTRGGQGYSVTVPASLSSRIKRSKYQQVG